VLFTFNTLLLAILNGKKEVERYVIANIIGSILALIVTSIMVIQFGLYGALVALAVYQSINFFATFFLCYRASWFKIRYVYGRIDKQTAYKLAQYTVMALTSAACVPVSHILVRNHLGETLGWAAAGNWEAMWRLSAAYLMLATTTLSIYYLPKFSELNNYKLLKREIISGYKLIIPVTIFSAFILYLLRDFIITILFTDSFSKMRELFALQMVGDVLKIGGWLLGYLMLGRAMFKLFIISEIIFSISFVALTFIFTKTNGIQGVVMAHAVNYGLYWLTTAVLLYLKFKSEKEKNPSDFFD
jgi:PST family polysaccharide transporter